MGVHGTRLRGPTHRGLAFRGPAGDGDLCVQHRGTDPVDTGARQPDARSRGSGDAIELI